MPRLSDFQPVVTPVDGFLLPALAPDAASPTGYQNKLIEFDAASPDAVVSIPLFTTAAGSNIPAEATMVQTAGYRAASDGGHANYLYDATVNAAYVLAHPLISFLSADGRGWKLAPTDWPDIRALGGTATSGLPALSVQQANTAAVQEALWVYSGFHLPEFTTFCDPDVSIQLFPLSINNGSGTYVISGNGVKGPQGSKLRWVTDNANTRPMMHIVEGYIDGADDTLRNPDGSMHAPNLPQGPPTGRALLVRDCMLQVGPGRYSTILYAVNLSGNEWHNVNFASPHRGILNASSFGSRYVNCTGVGSYYSVGRTLAEVEGDFPKSFGIYESTVFTVEGGSYTNWGTALQVGGQGASISDARMEVNECALGVGQYQNFYWSYWQGSGTGWINGNLPSVGLSVRNLPLESNRNGFMICTVAGSATQFLVQQCIVTGSAGAVPLGRTPAYGIVCGASVTQTAAFVQNSVSVSALYGDFLYQGNPDLQCNTAINWTPTASFSATAPDARARRTQLNRFKNNALAADRQMQSYDTQMMLRGITGMDAVNAAVFCNNVGGTATVGAAAVFVDITFPTLKGSGTATITSGPTAGGAGGTIPTGTYFYARTILGKRGETGVQWKPGDLDTYPGTPINYATYKQVSVTLGQTVTMGFSAAGTGYVTRIYRGDLPGRFTGFTELPATDNTFTDDGTVNWTTNKGAPPPGGGQIPAQAEVDANYGVNVTPSWQTDFWVTNKTTTGFRINFAVAPGGAGLPVDWMIYRG